MDDRYEQVIIGIETQVTNLRRWSTFQHNEEMKSKTAIKYLFISKDEKV